MSALLTDLGIAELIERIRTELIKSEMKRRQNDLAPLFETERCEIEIKCVLQQAKNAEGKLDLKLVAISAGQEVTEQMVHTVKVFFRVPSTNGALSEHGSFETPPGLRPRHD